MGGEGEASGSVCTTAACRSLLATCWNFLVIQQQTANRKKHQGQERGLHRNTTCS